MKRKYKVLLVCGALVSLLLCSVFSVGAAGQRYGTVSSEKIESPSFSATPERYMLVFDVESVYWNGTNRLTSKFVRSDYIPSFEMGGFSISGFTWGFWLDLSDFDFDPLFNYHLKFDMYSYFGAYKNSDYYLVFSIDNENAQYGEDNGTIVSEFVNGGSSKDLYSFDVYLTKEYLNANKNTRVFCTLNIEFVSGYVPFNTDPYLTLSNFEYTSLTDEESIMVETGNQIKASIQESTDQITNGWSPDPEKPQGSENVDDMTNLEDQILNESQEGIDTGNNLLQNFETLFTSFTYGFLFFIGIFNLLFGNSWLTTLLQISLVLGLIAFILNLVPAIGSKLGRDRSGQSKSKGKGGG